ncbi:MAG TPA: DUF1996 domain-containing protein [Acidimicrobiia bacterium]|nr:DUF1996 domain-containing protein [Acidimicrobiia bacterium]
MRHPDRPPLPHLSLRPWKASLLLVLFLVASALPAVTAGAAAGVGSFRVACNPSHDGTFDPIVFPAQSPAGHHHEFYGSTATGPSSTPGSLLGSSTTCSDSADSSGYWHPTVFFNGIRAQASLVSVYYTQRTTKKPVADVQAPPAGLRIIAGDGHAQSPQDITRVWWDCDGVTMDHQPSAPTCPPNSRGLEVNVRFPDCWDGANLDSTDHKSHMSYSVNDGGTYQCDAAHPVSLPFVHMIFRWDGQYPAGESVTLSSGSALTFHADFMNGWDQQRLASLIDQCIKTQTECGRIDSGTSVAGAIATAVSPTAAASSTTTAATTAGATTQVTSGAPADTTHEHTAATTATRPPDEADVPSGGTTAPSQTSATVTTMIAPPGSAAEPKALEPEVRAISRNDSGERGRGAVEATAAALAAVLAGAGLWTLAKTSYYWLRRPPTS